ncbi:hypothetical protein H634G_11570 [Metarhizium anisopliae BRIP 53293]|uniref:Uncharacterized protein n=1 Tax=Metarhizium anisopliae BRIP 53293 TaxID=1291518 RepID=A0A0D9NHW3_METAN|nr:hypothetical protein H634G_11570 [Metarhizium anisopliae BRIP 53293]
MTSTDNQRSYISSTISARSGVVEQVDGKFFAGFKSLLTKKLLPFHVFGHRPDATV